MGSITVNSLAAVGGLAIGYGCFRLGLRLSEPYRGRSGTGRVSRHLLLAGTLIAAVASFMTAAADQLLRSFWSSATISLLVVVLLTAAVTDISCRMIPNRLMLPAAAILFLLLLLQWPVETLYSRLLGGAVSFLLFLLMAVFAHGGVGGGDIKLVAWVGLVIGLPKVLSAIFLASLAGAFYGSLMVLIGGFRERTVPFAPFLAAGTLFVYLYRPEWHGWVFVDMLLFCLMGHTSSILCVG
ncbi:MAG: prepilin peptidase [Brevibacillus sp.]|nr:prepilin peptidase [Brevibacillus sp.]